MAKTLVIAHRGASLRAVENSMTAFTIARDLGADWIELDVQLSADGEAVVFHDEELDRLTKQHGPLHERSADALTQMEIGSGGSERIPLLKDVLDHFEDIPLYIELKSDGRGLESERNRKLLDRCCVLLERRPRHAIASFDLGLVREASRRGLPAVLIFSQLEAAESLSESERRGLLALSARGDLLEAGVRELAAATDTPLWLWTLDEPASMRRAMELGAHGICSNDVALARSVVDEWWK